ncbi:MAG: hypothetical protein ABIP12_05905, partial [Terriglobales bacterium]
MVYPTLDISIWIATASLQHRNPGPVSVDAIRKTLAKLFPEQARSTSVGTYLSQVLVATKKRYHRHLHSKMLVGTGKERRLFRDGDEVHPDRVSGKQKPQKQEVPEKFWYLIDWYDTEYNRPTTGQSTSQLRPSGDPKQWLQFVG